MSIHNIDGGGELPAELLNSDIPSVQFIHLLQSLAKYVRDQEVLLQSHEVVCMIAEKQREKGGDDTYVYQLLKDYARCLEGMITQTCYAEQEEDE